MGSTKEFTEYIMGQVNGDITCKKMFGEYGVYLNGKIIGLICNNTFYLKPTETGKAILGENLQLQPPYVGAKPYFLIDETDDIEFLTSLVTATYNELPEPKPKRKKAEQN